jgi:phosphoribosylformylglycinamidine synthase
MQTSWQGKEMVAPLSLIVTAFAPVGDVGEALTPQLRTDAGETELVLIDLGRGKNRLGGSILAQVHGAIGDVCPDLDDAALLKRFFEFIQENRKLILAYHDRSDGGLFVTACEMAFAGHCGVTLSIDALAFEAAGDDVDAFRRGAEEQLAGKAKDLALAALFSEELARAAAGACRRPRARDGGPARRGLGECSQVAAGPGARRDPRHAQQPTIYSSKRDHVQRAWAKRPTACRRCATTRTARARNTTV